jgi:hypothetical protein
MTEIGEARDAWGMNVWKRAEAFANEMKHVDEPFYIVYACKPDKSKPGQFRQAFKAYYQKPPAILGILVWKVDNKQGLFEFQAELSAPPDIPLDPKLLSNKESDSFASIAHQGKKLHVLHS